MPRDTARQAFDSLKEHLATVEDLNAAASVLSWDQQTYMPPGGAEARAAQLATLARLSHEQFASARTESLLGAAASLAETSAPDSDEAALLRVTRRDLDKATKLPAEFVAERGLHLHFGHGLNYHNVPAVARLPGAAELNIGHSIVSRAVLVGMERAVREMKEAIRLAL